MAQQQPAAVADERLLQVTAQHLHRSLQVKEPQRRLCHLQHRCPIKHGSPIRRLLGVELQLQIQKPPQALIRAASAQHQQVGDRHACEHSGGERGWP